MASLTPELMWQLPRVGSPVASDDWVVVPVTTSTDDSPEPRTRLWRMGLNGQDLRPLTRAEGSSASRPVISPDGGRLLFLRLTAGVTQVQVMALSGGEPTVVTDLKDGVIGAIWAPDGESIIAVGNVSPNESEPDGVHTSDDALYRYWDRWLTGAAFPHLFHIVLSTGETRDLTPGATRWMRWENTGDPLEDVAVSPDGRTVVYCADSSAPPHADRRVSLFAIDLESGSERRLIPEFDGDISSPRFSESGQLMIGLQDEPGYYAAPVQLALVNPASGDVEPLDLAGWDRSPMYWEWNGDTLDILAEDASRMRLFNWSPGGGQPVALTDGGSVTGFARCGDTVIVSHSSLVTPPELSVVTQSGFRAITSFTTSYLADIPLPRVEELAVPGGDDGPIQTFVLSPTEDVAPLVHMIHGGPHGIFGDQWHWRWNAAVVAAAGYHVALVNFAGSTSFGDAYARSIHGAWGDRPYRDIETVTDYLVSDGRVDPDRMAITGGSYGGYLVSWLTTQTDRYRCAVAHAAVTDLPGMYASDITLGLDLAYGAHAYSDLDRVQRWSPLAHAGSITTPTLVIHGDKDYRVPVDQGLKLYGMLQSMGVESRLLHYSDEGHWILNRSNSLLWYSEILDWLGRFLR